MIVALDQDAEPCGKIQAISSCAYTFNSGASRAVCQLKIEIWGMIVEGGLVCLIRADRPEQRRAANECDEIVEL
jgi:hypothetical protein